MSDTKAGHRASAGHTKSGSKSAVKAKNNKQGVNLKLASAVGAPSQHAQATRKGKKAWRKNVNIEDVEGGLEEIRAEERVTGKSLQKTRDDELFQVDTTGDDKVRHILPKVSFAQLTSAKIIAQRSAVPAVYSRPNGETVAAGQKRRGSTLSRDEKNRLLRIAKKPRKGPFNSILDPTEYEAGNSIVELSTAVKESGKYDVWDENMEEKEDIPDGLEFLKKRPVKLPPKPVREDIEIPAVVEPHQGTSYNPPVDAHKSLLLQAHEAEEKRIQEAEKLAAVKEKMDKARVVVGTEAEVAEEQGLAPGMKLDDGEVNEDDDGSAENEEDAPATKKMPQRKTKAQRRKATERLAEKRKLAEKAANKRRLALLTSIKSLRKSADQLLAEREKTQVQKLQLKRERLQKGLAGQRIGKHKVPESEIVVQLGEDLSESLRGLKPEGNLFRDRFLSLQQRAIIEPRVPVLPKKRRTKTIEYEKHAWKRFE